MNEIPELEEIVKEIIEAFGNEFRQNFEDFLEVTEGEDSLQIILRGHLYVEYELERLLRNHLDKPDYILSDRFMFMSKLNLAIALGLVPESRKLAYKKLNDLRNKYAHKLKFQMSEKDLNDFISVMDEDLRKEVFDSEWGKKNREGYEQDETLKLKDAILSLWSDSTKRIYSSEVLKFKGDMEFIHIMCKFFEGSDVKLKAAKRVKMMEVKKRLEEISIG